MRHHFIRVASAEVVGDHSLRLLFSDGHAKILDFSPVLHGTLFAPLRNPEFFRQVTIDPEVGTLVWPNGADFDPSSLYEWEAIVDELSARLRIAEEASSYGDRGRRPPEGP